MFLKKVLVTRVQNFLIFDKIILKNSVIIKSHSSGSRIKKSFVNSNYKTRQARKCLLLGAVRYKIITNDVLVLNLINSDTRMPIKHIPKWDWKEWDLKIMDYFGYYCGSQGASLWWEMKLSMPFKCIIR